VAQEAHLAEEDPRAGNSWEALGEALDGQKKYAEALPALQRAVACYRRAGPAWASKADEIQKTIDAR
jgi:tetratricopeptide (TPR) repeat protein